MAIIVLSGELTTAKAADPLLKVESSFLWSNVRDLVADGQYVYCAIGPGIQIYDLSDPAMPVLVSETLLSRRPLALDLLDGVLFIGVEDSGAVILDVHDPVNPTILSRVEILCSTSSVAASEFQLYLGCDHSVQLVDIRNVENPALGAKIDIPHDNGQYVRDLLVYGDTCVVAAYDLWIFDCSELSDPQLISFTHDQIYLAWSLAKQDTLLVLGNESPAIPGYRSAITVYNIRNAGQPIRLGEFEFIGSVWDLVILDNTVVFAGAAAGFAVLDISDLAQISPVYCHRQEDYECNSLCLSAGTLLAGSFFNDEFSQNFTHRELCTGANWVIDHVRGPLSNWLEIFDLSNPFEPDSVGSISDEGVAGSTQINGSIGFVLEEVGGISLVDLGSMPVARKLGYLPFALQDLDIYSGRILLDGNVLYVARPSFGVYSVDISNPLAPHVLDSVRLYYKPAADLEAPAETVGLELVDHYVYAATGIYGLVVIDKSNPLDLEIVGQLNPGQGVADIAIEGNRAYLAAGFEGGWIADISNPANPTLLGSFTPNGFNVVGSVTVRNGIVAYASSGLEFTLADANDLNNITILAEVATPDIVNTVLYWDSLLVVAERHRGIEVYDLAIPELPRAIQISSLAGNIVALERVQDRLFIGAEVAGYELHFDPQLDISDESIPPIPTAVDFMSVDAVRPNPFNTSTTIEFDVFSPGNISVQIVNVLGKSVCTIANEYYASGKHRVEWDGSDSDSQTVASGVYFIIFRREEVTVSTKALLLK